MDQSSPQSVANPNKWSDKDFQPWLFGYDTVKLTNDFLDSHLAQPFEPEKDQLITNSSRIQVTSVHW